jgi:plasmid stability protein
MATLTIRGLGPAIHTRLQEAAARHGRSVAAEVRAILEERLAPDSAERGLGSRIHARFQGCEDGLELPERSDELPRTADRNLAQAIMHRFSELGGAELDLPPRSTAPRVSE